MESYIQATAQPANVQQRPSTKQIFKSSNTPRRKEIVRRVYIANRETKSRQSIPHKLPQLSARLAKQYTLQ